MKKIIATDKAPAAVGPYSQAVLVNGLLFVSGQIPVNPADGSVAESIEDQSHQALKNVGAILAEAGLGYEDVVKTTVLLTNIADFAAVNEIYASFFEGTTYPARCAYQVSALPAGALVEIETICQK